VNPLTGSSARKLLFFLLRLAFAVVLLSLLIRSGRLDLDVLLNLRPDSRQWTQLVLGAFAIFGGLFLLGLRLRWLLGTIGLRVDYLKSLRVTFLGVFFGTLLPGLVGGDVVKAAALCKGLPRGRRMTVGAVMADRLVGLYAWFLLAALGILFGSLSGKLPDLPRTILALPILVSIAAPLALVLGRLAGRGVLAIVPSRAADVLERLEPILASLGSLSASPRLLAGVVFLSLVNHSLIVFAFAAGAEVLRIPLTPTEHWILDPLALTLNALPFSPGGLGLAEGAFSYLYEAVGVSQGAAAGVLGRALLYIVYAVGGLFALVLPEGRSVLNEGEASAQE